MDIEHIKNNYTIKEQEEIVNKLKRNITRKKVLFEKIEKEKIINSINIGDEINFVFDGKGYSGELLRKNRNSFVVKFLDSNNNLRQERREYKFFIDKFFKE